jgi:hypothetical protein
LSAHAVILSTVVVKDHFPEEVVGVAVLHSVEAVVVRDLQVEVAAAA